MFNKCDAILFISKKWEYTCIINRTYDKHGYKKYCLEIKYVNKNIDFINYLVFFMKCYDPLSSLLLADQANVCDTNVVPYIG